MNGVVIGIRCHNCSRFLPPSRVLRFSGEYRCCDDCWARHERCLRMLAGAIPPGCMDCGFGADGNIRLWVHLKDGVYQMLCRSCSDAYVKKRADLYGDTESGHARKLK